MSGRVIANEKEILKILSTLARGGEEIKASEQLKAAELLGKHYCLFDGGSSAVSAKDGEIRILVDYGGD